MLIRMNINTVLDTAISAPNLMIRLSTSVKRATTKRITRIRINSRLRRLRSFSESQDFLLNLGLFMAFLVGRTSIGGNQKVKSMVYQSVSKSHKDTKNRM